MSLQEIPLGDLYRAKGVALASVGQADSSAYFLVDVENRRVVVLLLVLVGSAQAIMRSLVTTDRELIDLASFTLRQAVIPAFQRSELLEPLETQYHQTWAKM